MDVSRVLRVGNDELLQSRTATLTRRLAAVLTAWAQPRPKAQADDDNAVAGAQHLAECV